MKKQIQAQARLKKMRQQIDRLDQKIVHVLAQRFAVVRQISKIKKDLGLPVLQKKRKGEIRQTRLQQGQRLKLRATFIERIFNSIQAESIYIQKQDRRK